jgi:hypothetical protein
MKILLLHPEDVPDGGAWSREPWDLVVDLGFAGTEAYTRDSRSLNSRFLSIHQFARHPESYRWVNQFLERGRGKLLDRAGLDWWEILANEGYQDIHILYLFRQFQRELRSGRVELAGSRPHRFTRIAEQVFGSPVRYFGGDRAGLIDRSLHALLSARKLQPAQIAEIVFDKWDSGYQVRRHFKKHLRTKVDGPCVLLPSAYSNVTRSVLAYASQLPDRKFLLIGTRRNAEPKRTPLNVTVCSIAAYVRSKEMARAEVSALQKAWAEFASRMRAEDEEFLCTENAGVWNYLPAYLEQGLLLRDAWSEVLQSELVAAVLCGDDLNYATRLPLFLAQKAGLNAVYCSHGALDSGFFFKKPYADSFLVKGDMERDYLERAAAIGRDRIIVGAPTSGTPVSHWPRSGEAIVFFSQPYEVIGGRPDAIYRQIIPGLYSVATANKRKLIIKLHPFESKWQRQALLKSVLADADQHKVEVIGGVPPEQVMSRAWCGVTINSSVAVECAMHDIPFFLCGWLDFTADGYLEQFARYGVAEVLQSPEDIHRIPQMVADYRADPVRRQKIWQAADPNQLDAILFATRQVRVKQCAC